MRAREIERREVERGEVQRPGARPDPLGKTVIDVIDAAGVVCARYRFDTAKSPITIGRSAMCDVILDDPHTAPVHAILEITPSATVRVSDAGSINGIVVDGTHHRSASGLALPHERFAIGRTIIRVRASEGVLAPEARLDGETRTSRLRHPTTWAALFSLCLAAFLVYQAWLAAPQELLPASVMSLVVPFALIGGWVASWSLLTRIIRGAWRFAPHMAIAAGTTLLYELVSEAATLGAFMSGLRLPQGYATLVGLALFSAGLALHMRLASTLSARHVLATAIAVPLVIGAGVLWINSQMQRHLPGMASANVRLYPPALRMTAAEPAIDFFKRASTLRAKADKRRSDTASDADD